MSFRRDPSGVYRAEILSCFTWLDHGFGTRHAAPHPAPVTLKQIHSDLVLPAGAPPGCEGDALLASQPGHVVAVKTADCVPILLADPVHRVAAAVHAGWKGTALHIVRRAVERLYSDFGSNPASLHAAIGPAIGPCCYEVGPDVASRFAAIFPERRDLNSKTKIDLPEANRRLLAAAGIAESNIASAGLCTFCASYDFFSWRREGEAAGRMLSAVGIRCG